MKTADELSHTLTEGGYILKGISAIKREVIKHIFIMAFRLFVYAIVYLVTFLITLYIFLNCILEMPESVFSNLEPSISLGAIFATLGSAIVAIYSLYCNEQLRKFHETLNTLQTSLLETASWTRWEFIKRYHVVKLLDQYYCYCLVNPSITFYKNKKNLKLFVPYSKEDFYEQSAFISYCKITRLRKQYFCTVYNFQQINYQSEQMILDCLSFLYRSIINYKKGRFFLVVGCFFIFNSILFSLFYYAIWKMLI